MFVGLATPLTSNYIYIYHHWSTTIHSYIGMYYSNYKATEHNLAILVGGFNPSEKYESQLGWLFPTEWKNKINVPNNQPVWFTLAILIDHHWSLIHNDPYPHASTWIFWIHIGLIKRCTFRNHTNTFIGPGSILEYRTHYKPSFKCPFFPAFTTHAGIHYPLRQAMELVNWFVNAWFQPITCVAVKGSNPITNSSKQVVFISSRS
jgi:hypothetical protein